MQKLVIFDLDGTLIDTSALMVQSVAKVFLDEGYDAPDDKSIRAVSGLGRVEGFARLAPNVDPAQRTRLMDAYQSHYLAGASKVQREALFPGISELLKTLSARDDILLAVATGKSLPGTNRVLQAHGIEGLFSSIHTPDTRVAKPHPDMIDCAREIVSVPAWATIMIGDTTHDMAMARNAGVKALGVTYGYHERQELLDAGADMLIDEVEQMIGAIDTLLGAENA